MDQKSPSEGEPGPLSAVSSGAGAEKGKGVGEGCFSCGPQGHGVNRCSRVGTSFLFLQPWWSVEVRNGQYWAIRTVGTGLGSHPGNEGWSGREGQPPGPSGMKVRLTPAGELVIRGDVSWLGSCSRVRFPG